MEDIVKLSLHDYENVQQLTNEELIKLISEIIDIEEVQPALYELYKRDCDQAMMLGKKLLENNEGDEYLQAAVIEFIFEYDKQYIIDFTIKNIGELHWYIFSCILDCFSMESKQKFGKQLSSYFIETILNRYDYYDQKEKDKIKDSYMWFLNSYLNT